MLMELFANFERIIGSELAEKTTLLPVPDPTYFKETVKTLQQDAKDIAGRLDTVYGKRSKTVLVSLSVYQDKTELLLKMLERTLEKELEIPYDAVVTSLDSWHAIIEKIAIILTGLLDHMLVNHWEKCDHFGLLPEFSVIHFHASRTEMLNKELAQIPEGTHCYEAFKLLLIPMDDWADDVSSMHFHYFDKLIGGVRNILNEKEEDGIKAKKIRELLWKMNFNHPTYANIILEELRPKAVDLDKKQLIKEYTRLKKEIKKRKHDPGDWDYGLYHKIGTLKWQVETMLRNEVIMLKALMLTESLVASGKETNYKVETFLPEAKVKDVLRLFSGKNMYFNVDREELLRVFSALFLLSGWKY